MAGGVALYARVSSQDQKSNLDAQLGRLVTFASSRNMAITNVVSEIGPGLNGHRPKLMSLLSDPAIMAIVVEHRDRLMRFGSEYVESAMKAQGRSVVVVDPNEIKDDLVHDMVEILTSFCVRLYGRRSARNRAERAMKAAQG